MNTAQIAERARRDRSAGAALAVARATRAGGRIYGICREQPRRGTEDTRWDRAEVPDVPVPLWIPHPGHLLRCIGQLVTVPSSHYDWLYVLLSARLDDDAEVWLHYANGIDPEPLRTGLSAHAHVARVPVPRADRLVAFRLPDIPGLDVRAVTTVSAREFADGG